MYMRRYKIAADKPADPAKPESPETKEKSKLQPTSPKEEWEYREFKEDPGGKWEKVEGSKNPNAYKIRVKDLPKEEKKKEEKPSKDSQKADELQKKTETEFDKYFGKTSKKEKARLEQEAANKIMDFIEKASKGDTTAVFPDLPEDMKAKFITAMFMVRKAKQLEQVKAPNKVIQKQKDQVLSEIYSKAMEGMNDVLEHISTRGRVERHIKMPEDPESIFKEVEPKDLRHMTSDEYADYLASKGIKLPSQFAMRRPEMRGKDWNDLPSKKRDNAKNMTDSVIEYRKNFGTFNKEIGSAVVPKTYENSVGFVMQEYKPSDNAVTANVAFPVGETEWSKLTPALNSVLKKLAMNGFKGEIRITTNPKNMLMDRNNIKIITDDVKTSQAASEMLREAFGEQKIKTKIDMEQNQFGMSEAEQFKYISNLKRLALNSTSSGKFNLPSDRIGKYMAAARLRGYDLVPSGKLYGLRVHSPDSPIGQIKLDSKTDPEAMKQALFDAYDEEQSGKKEDLKTDMPLDNPFEGTRKTMEEYIKENGEDVDVSPSSDEDFDERMNDLYKEAPSEEPVLEESVPVTEAKPVDIGDYDSTLKNMKDNPNPEIIGSMVDNMTTKLNDPIEAKAYGSSIGNYVKDIEALYSGKVMPPEVEEKISNLKKSISPSKPEPSTMDKIDFSGVDQIDVKTPLKMHNSYVYHRQVYTNEGMPTGWIIMKGKEGDVWYALSKDGTKYVSTKGSALDTLKDWVVKHPFKEASDKTWLDKIDNDDDDFNYANPEVKTGKKFLVNKQADNSSVADIGESYGIPKDSNLYNEMLGFKRLIFSNLNEEARKKIKEKGFVNYMGTQSVKNFLSDFVSGMSSENYPSGTFDDMKKKAASINPSDFVKIINGIKQK